MFCDTWNSGLIVYKQKFDWNTAMHIHLYIAYDSFHAMSAQVSSYHRGCMAYKAKSIYVIWSKGLGRSFQICHTQATTCCPSKASMPPTAICFILNLAPVCEVDTGPHLWPNTNSFTYSVLKYMVRNISMAQSAKLDGGMELETKSSFQSIVTLTSKLFGPITS